MKMMTKTMRMLLQSRFRKSLLLKVSSLRKATSSLPSLRQHGLPRLLKVDRSPTPLGSPTPLVASLSTVAGAQNPTPLVVTNLSLLEEATRVVSRVAATRVDSREEVATRASLTRNKTGVHEYLRSS
jgi:hypothetical protein